MHTFIFNVRFGIKTSASLISAVTIHIACEVVVADQEKKQTAIQQQQ